MATKTIFGLTHIATPVLAADELELQRAANGASAKAVFSEIQDAVMGQLWTIKPVYAFGNYDGSDGPGGVGGRAGAFTHVNYQGKVGAAAVGLGGGADEALTWGYNVGSVSAVEPSMTLVLEIDWGTTARGVPAQRTMEWYAQFGAPSNTGRTNAPRGIFFCFEPGDTQKGGTLIGQINYVYLSAGWNRQEHYPATSFAGGFRITADGNENSPSWFEADQYGIRPRKLRCVPDIGVISAATTVANCVVTTTSAANFKVGASIQIFRTDTNKIGWQDTYNTGGANGGRIFGVITAISGNDVTTNIDNRLVGAGGIIQGADTHARIGDNTTYFWGINLGEIDASFGAGTNYSPVFHNLAVGTSHAQNLSFTLDVVGTVGVVGKFGLGDSAYVTTLNRALDSNDFLDGIFNLNAASVATRKQLMTFVDAASPWHVGLGRPNSDYMFGFGLGQGTDSNFNLTPTRPILNWYMGANSNADLAVFIGDYPNHLAYRLALPPATTAQAQLLLANGGVDPSTAYNDGQVWRNGNSVADRIAETIEITPLKIRIGGASYSLLAVPYP